jgi:diguanylate cyclase (GGDEF)-like protein
MQVNNLTRASTNTLRIVESQGSLRILLVQDDQVDYRSTVRLLKQAYGENFSLTWATDAELAIKELNSGNFEICLIDYRLSKANGIDLLNQMHKEGLSDIAVILLTGMDSFELGKHAMIAGATDYLVKNDLKPELLERSIRYSLRQKETERKITYLAYYDSLTGLANRSLFGNYLERAITASERHHEYAAVLFIDLDNFKSVNDSLGHSIGDNLLIEIASRLKDDVRHEDVIARFGGDEFVLLLTRLDKNKLIAYEQVSTITEKIGETINRPIMAAGHEIKMSASIGATLFSENSIDSESLLRQADIAMYQAKSDGRDAVRFFELEMEETANSSYWIEQDLKDAITLGQLELYFQPIVDNKTKRIRGAETLIRWNHPERGLIPPNSFIPKAEESDLICAIGLFVLEQTCLYLKTKPKIDYVSINIGKRHFEDPLFADDVKKILDKTGVKPQQIVIELTENMFLKNTISSCEKMNSLKTTGLRFALDDFGTGYSSLSVLKDLPFDILKIDRAFTNTIGGGASNEAIILAIIAMANALGLLVIAEGLEQSKHVNFMVKHGCYGSQGFFFSRPVPKNEFDQLLMNQY